MDLSNSDSESEKSADKHPPPPPAEDEGSKAENEAPSKRDRSPEQTHTEAKRKKSEVKKVNTSPVPILNQEASVPVSAPSPRIPTPIDEEESSDEVPLVRKNEIVTGSKGKRTSCVRAQQLGIH